jgi:hypothetical protein
MTDKDKTETEHAIVKASPPTDDGFRFALEPAGFREAQTVAAIVAKAGICKVKTPEEAMIRMMTGRALGIPTFIALQHVYDVEGRPSLSSKLKVALCMRHPDCEYFELVESDEKHATYRTKRRGRDEVRRTFTVDMAVRAQLVKKDSNWEKWPHRMCQARASGELADVVFPDACMGMPSVEESYDARASELVGEVVTTAEPQPSPSPPQAAPMRDYASEVALLKHRISNAKTTDELKGLRKDAETFAESAGEPYAADVKAFYNKMRGELKNSKTETPDIFGGGT